MVGVLRRKEKGHRYDVIIQGPPEPNERHASSAPYRGTDFLRSFAFQNWWFWVKRSKVQHNSVFNCQKHKHHNVYPIISGSRRGHKENLAVSVTGYL